MASRAASLQRLWWPRPRLCRACAMEALPDRFFSSPQRRSLRTRFGPKYTAKLEQADTEWKDKARRIEEGTDPHVWDLLEERGYVKDIAGRRDDIRELMLRRRIGAYVGIDPTAFSLHVGHLLPLMALFWMYLHGYSAFTLVGGATAKIGDPTGRLTSRDKLENSTVAMNMAKINFQLKKLWANVETRASQLGYAKEWASRRGVVQNGHWWNKLPLLDVLTRLGAGLRIGPMLSRDTVRRKLGPDGDGMSFAEFAYPLMQAWDWWRLYESRGVLMQIGGSDQYGNVVLGADAVKLIRASEPDPARRKPDGPLHDPVGFTVPLLTDGAGAKLGKTAGNALWLDPYMTSRFDLYGYFHAQDPPARHAQHALAFEVLSLVHGVDAARETQAEHRALYGGGGGKKTKTTQDDDGNPGLDEYAARPGVPTTPNNAPRIDMKLPESLIRGGKIGRILYAAGLATSAGDGHRMAVQKAAYVGGSPGQKPNANKGMSLHALEFTPVSIWRPEDTHNFIVDDKYLVLRKGKHNLRIIEMVSDAEWEASGLQYRGQPYTGAVRQMRAQIKALEEEARTGGGVPRPEPERSQQLSEDGEDAAEAGPDATALVFPERKRGERREAEDRLAELKAAAGRSKGGTESRIR